ncbi:MAG: WD40/YVTN/BNR-like repeat-containing protein [Chthoniobacterales bacterium]
MLALGTAGRIVLAMAASNTATLYVGITNVNTGDLVGFYKTVDGCANWTQLTSTPDYCAGAFARWREHLGDAAIGPEFRLHPCRYARAHFLREWEHALGNDGGAYVATQITASDPVFTALNTSLGITQFYPGLTMHPTNPGIAIGGTQDNGTVLFSGAPTWNDVVCGDGGYTAIDFNTPSTIYAECQEIDIIKSTAGGAFDTWTFMTDGIDVRDRVDFIPPLTMDPSNSQTLYFGTDRVYQTTDGAIAWTAISPDLTSGDSFFGVLSTIAVAPNDSNTVYVGTLDSRVQVTTNAGAGSLANWTNVTNGLPTRVITNVAVDAGHSTTAYVAFSGFSSFDDNLGHVLKTLNGGGVWTDISGDLPNVRLTFSPPCRTRRTRFSPRLTSAFFIRATAGVIGLRSLTDCRASRCSA